jgi:hypothetical protein
MGKMPDGMSLERLNNSLPYSKENCKWATMKEQANNRINTIYIKHNGKRLTYSQWDEVLNLTHGTTRGRLVVYGWTKERALGK